MSDRDDGGAAFPRIASRGTSELDEKYVNRYRFIRENKVKIEWTQRLEETFPRVEITVNDTVWIRRKTLDDAIDLAIAAMTGGHNE